MDFALSAQAEDYSPGCGSSCTRRSSRRRREWAAHLHEHGAHEHPPVMERLKASARDRGLWNLFLPDFGGLSNVEYAAVAEITGWSPVIAPEAINCQAPDTGNMETLHLFATPEQRERWLTPLLNWRDPVSLRDDRTRRGLVGRHQHRDIHRARR